MLGSFLEVGGICPLFARVVFKAILGLLEREVLLYKGLAIGNRICFTLGSVVKGWLVALIE
jgi:hypothetical protein